MGNYYSGMMNATGGSELRHHGILGQKWGVRRFQNKDGTWTEAGKKKRRSEYDGSGYSSKDIDDSVDQMIKAHKGRYYKDVFDRNEAIEQAKRISGNLDNDSIEALADEIGVQFQKKKYELATGTKYSDLMKDTDFSKLSKNEKAKRELDILSINDLDVAESFDKHPQRDAYLHLGDRIVNESGNWYRSQPVTKAFSDVLNKIHSTRDKQSDMISSAEKAAAEPYSKREKELRAQFMQSRSPRDEKKWLDIYEDMHRAMNKAFDTVRNSDSYKSLTNDRRTYFNDLVEVVIKDIGYENTPEVRRLIRPMIFWN